MSIFTHLKGAVSPRAHPFCAHINLETTACSFQVIKSKMAAPSAVAHGGRRDNSGRKRKYSGSIGSQKGWNSANKRIYLSLTIFEAWRNAKSEAGYTKCSDSDFAAHLLSLEYRRR